MDSKDKPGAFRRALGHRHAPRGRLGRGPAGDRRAAIALVMVFVAVAGLVEGGTLYAGYNVAIREKTLELRNLVQVQASLIAAVARFDQEYSRDYPGGAFEATLSQIRGAHDLFMIAGEFTIARLQGDQIVFLLRHRLIDHEIPEPLPMNSRLGEPMRRALRGESGTVIGLDYRGVTVIGAYEPVVGLDVGLVAKADLAEVRAPFVRTGLRIGVLAGATILVGALIVGFLTRRLILGVQRERDRAETYLAYAGSLFVILDSQGSVQEVNERACEVLGYSREEMLGKDWFETCLPKDQRAEIRDRFDRVMAGEIESMESNENTVLTRHGEERLIAWHNRFLRDPATGDRVSISSGEDVTETRAAETEALRLGRITEESLTEVYVFEAESLRFITVNRGARDNLGYSMAELRGMTPLDFKPEFTEEAFARLLTPLRSGEKSNVVFETVHLRKDGSLYPVDVHIQMFPHGNNPVFVAHIRDLTEQVAAREAVLERESRFQAAAESLNDAFVIADDRGMIEFWNATAEGIFGWTSEEIVGQPLQLLIPQGWREAHAEGLRAAVERGALAHGDAPLKVRALRKDGTEFPVRVTLSTWTAAGQRRFAAVLQDTTAADLAEARMQQARRARVVAAGLATTLFESDAEEEFLDGVARLVVAQGHYPLCWIGSKLDDEAKTVVPIAQRGAEDGYVDSLQITWGEGDSGRGPTGTAIREERVTISRDMVEDPAYEPCREAGLERGFHSSIALPLRVDHEVIGAFNVYAAEPDAFQEEEIAILEAIAGNVSLGIAALRADEAREREAEVRRHAEHELRKLSQAVEEAPVSIIVTDVEGRYEYVNPKFTQLTGWTLDDVRGKTPRILKSGHTSDEEYAELWRAIRAGMVWHGEFLNKAKDGSTFWASASISPVFNSGSKITHFVGVHEDITARKEAEQVLEHERNSLAERVEERTAELSAAYAQLEGASRAKDEFLAGMSHELRTPLNTILTLAESLDEGVYGDLSAEQIKPLRTVMSSGTHLLSLINDLLDLSKIEAGKLELTMRPVRVGDVCEASLRLVKEIAHKKQLRVSTSIDSGVETVLADERRLKQILVNLLSNAVKFTDSGGEVGIEVTGHPGRDLVEFVVWDTGIGLREDQLDMLFQPFSQLDAGLDRKFEGTGLGLALVARMTEMHGGGVSVHSDGLGKGSRFTVSLPWTRDAQRRESAESEEASIDDGDQLEEALPPDAARILIVDDNENTLRAVVMYFRSKSFRVSVARNGEEAVARALEDRPDVILMDIQMPKMDGLEATRRIRKSEGSSRVPIIAVTALAMPGDRERCLEAGVDEYLTKPVSLKLLAERVGEMIEKGSGP